MSRFVRASKYRHVFGQNAKKEYGYENVKVTNSAWDTNIVSASGEYLSVNWNSSGGGAFAILPLPSPFHPAPSFPYKLPDSLPLARGHTATVLDTDWSPHNDAIVASGGEDGKAMIWKVDASTFDGWGADGWEPTDFDPVLRIDASARKVGQVLFHPTASNVLATAAGDAAVKLWDLANPEDPRAVLSGHGDIIQSLAFNPTGTLLVTTCRDRKLRLFDPRAGGDPVRVNDGHSGIKGSRVVWMGELDRIATTGFSKMSERQAAIWEAGSLTNLKTIALDQSAGVVMPFWSDNNILFLAGKGDGNIRYYEYESDSLFSLSEYKSSDPQRGMCFLPRRALNVSDCEIARAYKVHGSSIEPIAFIVPRKADGFQSDIFPPAPSSEPSLSASEFFNGKSAPANYISLADGSAAKAPPSAPSPAAPAPAPAPASPTVTQPTRSFSTASASIAVETPVREEPPASSGIPTTGKESYGVPTTGKESYGVVSPTRKESYDVPTTGKESYGVPSTGKESYGVRSSSSREESWDAPVPTTGKESYGVSPGSGAAVRVSASASVGGAGSGDSSALKDENAKLTAELREAREKIRNLELQVESLRANARKAAQLLDS